MLVSHAKAFIYVKTVKTAGTSVEQALERFCCPPPHEAAPPEAARGVETPAGIIGLRGDDVREARWFHHMPARQIRKQLDRPVWRRYLRVCNIRNPWDKTVSWFHFRHPELRDRDPETILPAFRRWIATAERVGQDFGIYAIRGRPVMDVYLRHDHLDQDVARLAERLALGPLTLPRLKAGFRGPDRIDYRSYYNTASRARVAALYAPAITVFGWQFDSLSPGRLPERPAKRNDAT